MTKQAVKRMIKVAKNRSALDSAMEFAERTGKPTSTGIAAGAGLGTILAAIGALNRAGVDQKNQSVLSNPLLLGTLGAAGGYLAGNAFERKKPIRNNHSMSLSAMLGLLGGTGTVGTLLAKEDAQSLLEKNKGDVNDLAQRFHLNPIRDARGSVDYDISSGRVHKRVPVIDRATGQPKLNAQGRPITKTIRRALTPEEVKEFTDARNALGKAYVRAGDFDAAAREAGLDLKEIGIEPGKSKPGNSFMRWLRYGKTSPWSWMKSLNPFKGPVSHNGEAGIKLLTSQLGKVVRNNPKTTSLAALALLAGGGKAVYDYTKD